MSPEAMKRAGIIGAFVFALWTAGVLAFVTAGPSPDATPTAGAAQRTTTTPTSASAGSAEPTKTEPTVAEPTTAAASAAPFGDPADLPDGAQAQGPEQEAPKEDRPQENRPQANRAAENAPPRDRQPSGAVSGADKEGAGGSLEGLERERAQAGAYNFILYAYGTPTDDPVQYESLVNQAVVPSTFETSPGASAVAAVADSVAQGGYEDALATTNFELLTASGDTAEFEATFVLESPSGEKRELAQTVEVESLGPLWKVSRAQPLEER